MLAPLAGRWFSGVVRGRRIPAGWGATYGYPGLQLDAAGDEVAVQVFESAALAEHWEQLDAFEGAEYERVPVDVQCASGSIRAYVYVIRSSS